MIILNSPYLIYTFVFQRLGECTFWTWEWKSYLSYLNPIQWSSLLFFQINALFQSSAGAPTRLHEHDVFRFADEAGDGGAGEDEDAAQDDGGEGDDMETDDEVIELETVSRSWKTLFYLSTQGPVP